MRNNGESEKRIFEEFAKIAKLDINIKTIRKNAPPKPDISCVTNKNNKLDFEVTELIDENIARMVNEQFKYERLLRELEDLIGVPDREKIHDNLKGALIAVEFKPTLDSIKKRQGIQKLSKYLINIKKSFNGEIDLNGNTELSSYFNRINVSRGSWDWISYQIADAVSYADPSFSSLMNKFKKDYETDVGVNLLIFVDLQPESLVSWEGDLIMRVKDVNGRLQKFKEIWIFYRGKGQTKKIN